MLTRSHLHWVSLLTLALTAACLEPIPTEDGGVSPSDDAEAGTSDDGSLALDSAAGDGGESDGATPDAGPGTACHNAFTGADIDPLCASCACGRCSSESEACQGDEKCLSAAACMLQNACTGMTCYCGTDPLGCAFGVKGPCKAAFEAAAGKPGETEVKKALNDANSALGKANALRTCTASERCKVACSKPEESCGFVDLSCQQRYCDADPALEMLRAKSALETSTPTITKVSVNGAMVWSSGSSDEVALSPGDKVVLEGTGFGAGTEIDFSKLLVGNVRILETDVTAYEQQLDISRQVHSETPTVRSRWPKDILGWSSTRIEFQVPKHVTRGPIMVQVQKRLGATMSYVYPGREHSVLDTQTMRIADPTFAHKCDVVSTLSDPVASNTVPVKVVNPELAALVKKGREIFWSYDYNIGLTHSIRGLNWTDIMTGKTKDPMTGQTADPLVLFGAYKTVAGEVPAEAIDDVYFNPYPQKNPIPGWLLVISSQKTQGNTSNTGYVGYRYAESTNPYTGDGKWIGFNCGSCHGYRVSWESAPGQTTTKVIGGLPNPRWSMKWAVLGNFKGVVGDEPGPIWDPGVKKVDKTALVYAVPHGHGEHDMIRLHGEGSLTDNDYGFAPIAIPNVTYYLPIRRSLSHTESYVGFEGSYVHAEEPDGALGSMDAESLKALTAYMGQLDAYDDQLRAVGVYRMLKHKGQSALYDGVSEGAFVQKGPRAFPAVAARLDAGQAIFEEHCASCHQDKVGQFSSEKMFPLHEVGRFFEPTVYHREMQSVRVSFLRDLYFTQHRGLLSDGHVRNLEDLVHPDRCKEGSELYDRYYTLHPPATLPSAGPDFPAPIPHENVRGDVFRVQRSTDNSDTGKARNTFVERFRYFSKVSWDNEHYYWDYQKMRREYGPWELGSAGPIGLPAAPHPWCAKSAAEVDDLVLYLSSL